jgi:beta-lactamase class A
VASGWGLDPLSHLVADRGLRLVNKTGTDTGVRADVGILTGRAASIAYAVVANWDASGADDRDAVLARQREIGLVVAELARGERPDERRLGEW